MTDIEKVFAQFDNPNYFSRVDNSHPLELHVGLDDKGRKAIELRSIFKPRKINGTGAIAVNQYKKSEYNTIRFSLCDEEVSGLFFQFCEDLIDQTRGISNKNEGYQAIVGRFYQWKKLFISNKRNLLTEPQIMGLIGEILFLKDHLSKRIGWDKALRSWSGQELTHKDFSFSETWAEVKTVNRSALCVRISSLEQLDSDTSGELDVFFLEKMSPAYNGISLNKLIIETKNRIGLNDDQDLFLSKVALQGYEYNNYYDDFVYEISGYKKYRVDDFFPKLTVDDVPPAITKASYDISLKDISDYEIADQ